MPPYPKSSVHSARIFAFAVVGALLCAPLSYAFAAGGGGGVGGSAPSASAPRYDPAEEYRKGVDALNAGSLDQAVRHFKKVTRVARESPDAHYLLGVSYMRGGDFKKARRPLESAVKYAPERVEMQRDLALAYVELELMDDAREILSALNTRNGACAGTCADNASLAQAISAIESAMESGLQAALSGPDVSLFASAKAADQLYYSAVGLINDGQYEAALDQLDNAALAFGPHPDILTYQGFANRKLARFERAEAYYNRALSIAPDHIGALEYYGELKVERGDLKGARSHLARIEVLCDFGCFEAEELREWIDKSET